MTAAESPQQTCQCGHYSSRHDSYTGDCSMVLSINGRTGNPRLCRCNRYVKKTRETRWDTGGKPQDPRIGVK